METALDVRIANAVAWGLARLGRTEWRGKCLGFVEDCYERSNGLEVFGGDTAMESARQYPLVKDGDPPVGALVFYACEGPLDGVVRPWGHVGLVVESGQLLHAWDQVRITPLSEMEALVPPPGWSPLAGLGWAPAEAVLEGCRAKEWGAD